MRPPPRPLQCCREGEHDTPTPHPPLQCSEAWRRCWAAFPAPYNVRKSGAPGLLLGFAAEPLNPRPYNIIYFPTGWAFSAKKKVFERVRDQM